MSIKFICSCGKHLRARDEMAARRSMCPRCGAPVGIPSLRPTHSGTSAAVMTPQEIRRRSRTGLSQEFFAPKATPRSVPEAPAPTPKRLRRARNLEERWYQCLAFPFANAALLHGFTLSLTALTAIVVLALQDSGPLAELKVSPWTVYVPTILGALLLFAYVCGTIECGLTSALDGRGPGLFTLGWRVDAALKSGVRWLVALMAGPLGLLYAAGHYWLYGGDLLVLDWIILGEMGVFAVAYGFLSLVCTIETNSVLAANPLAVMRLIQRLGYRAAMPILVVPVLVFAHGFVGIFAASKLHNAPAAGVFLLLACSWSALFCGFFVFRLLGVWCYRAGTVGAGP